MEITYRYRPAYNWYQMVRTSLLWSEQGGGGVMNPVPKPVRCAIYTRKSTEDGLDQEFNSLDAQREACEAYILSQRHEGWKLVPDAYDDGGYSGGTMERPGLKALMHAVENGLVDVIVVYKVDRRDTRRAESKLCVDYTGVQYNYQHGQAYAQCVVVLRTVRTRGNRRAYPRQDCRFQEKRHLDGRAGSARIYCRGSQTGC